MVKNQYLLGALVVLGAVNLLTFFGLISSESSNARALKSLEQDVAKARDEQHQAAATLANTIATVRDEQERAAVDLKRAVDEVRAGNGQLQDDVDKVRTRLIRAREELQALEKRVDKFAPARDGGKEAGQ
jgi:chromosome segregation ATPase